MGEDKNRLSARDKFVNYLHEHNMRCTPERFVILDAVMATVDHFSIEAFHKSIENAGFHVSTATIYNTLELLTDCGLVRRHQFDNKSSRFEKLQGVTNHHHLICTYCGKIKEVKDMDVARLLNAKRYPSFNTSYFSLYLYGTCSRCARKKKREGKKQKQ